MLDSGLGSGNSDIPPSPTSPMIFDGEKLKQFKSNKAETKSERAIDKNADLLPKETGDNQGLNHGAHDYHGCCCFL